MGKEDEEIPDLLPEAAGVRRSAFPAAPSSPPSGGSVRPSRLGSIPAESTHTEPRSVSVSPLRVPQLPEMGSVAYLEEFSSDADPFELEVIERTAQGGGSLHSRPPESVSEEQLWPLGVTPLPEELDVSVHEIERAARYGELPSDLWRSPLYAFRVFWEQRRIRPELERAEHALSEVEDERDAELAGWVEEQREALLAQGRYSESYVRLEPVELRIAELSRSLAQTDTAGASRLDQLRARQEEAERARVEQERRTEIVRGEKERAETVQARSRAQLNRFAIELRNLENTARQQAPEGAPLPAALAVRQAELEEASRAGEVKWLEHKREFEERQAELAREEEALRRARADEQRLEGEKETFSFSLEGQKSEQQSALDAAQRDKRRQLGEMGRAFLALRGEVPLDRERRARLLGLDKRVGAAARVAWVQRLALDSVDTELVQRGRVLGAIFVFVLVLLLFWLL